jgi:Xaa-Pro aminopeptidase
MCSDITRVFVAGRASAEQSALYKAVLAVQEKALLALKAGVNGREVHQTADAAVSEFFRKAGAPGKMGHSLGHSIGLYPHDGKRIGPVDYTIPENFVTTVEPAGYLPGFGGVRIEDTVLVTRRNVEILTEKAPKAILVEIK